MQAGDLAGARWRTSSRSGGGGEETNCVEVAEFPDRVAMRDSKDPAGPVLVIPRDQWQVFVGGVRTSRFG